MSTIPMPRTRADSIDAASDSAASDSAASGVETSASVSALPAPTPLPPAPPAPAPSDPAALLPARRKNLVVRSRGDGECVIKDRSTGSYFELGKHETFLLLALDGRQTVRSLCAAFEEHFSYPLAEEDVSQFLALADSSGLLQRPRKSAPPAPEASPPLPSPATAAPPNGEDGGPSPVPRPNGKSHPAAAPADSRSTPPPQLARPAAVSLPPSPSPASPAAVGVTALPPSPASTASTQPRRRQSLLYWRKTVFDPDALFDRLEPKLRFLWTGSFFFLSAACIAGAAAMVWTERAALVGQFNHAFGWQMLALAWLILVAATVCHEFAHGLTLKHYGGEVREIGFLLVFFTPCFFCNVSDAWLLPQKRKRLWVSFSGAYCDMLLWALAVFVWRVSFPDSVINFAAWVVLTVCGGRILFNLNPLMKYDGYYLVSDWLEIPNLRSRSWEAFLGRLRWALWGGPKPQPEPRGRFLFWFGAASWLYSVLFLGLLFVGLLQWLGSIWGLAGAMAAVLVAVLVMRGVLKGVGGNEIAKMLEGRPRRVGAWAVTLAVLAVAVCLARVQVRVGAPFQMRPPVLTELRAPVAGFLRELRVEEGDRVSAADWVATLEVPDLSGKVAQKRAEAAEEGAKLRLLEAGPRREEVEEQRRRVARAEQWQGQGERDVEQSRRALAADLGQSDALARQYEAEVACAAAAMERADRLREQSAMADSEFQDHQKKLALAQAQLAQARAQRLSREAQGTMLAEAELGRRQRECAESKAVLTLMEAGTRPEEVAAQRARVERLREELRTLEDQQARCAVRVGRGGMGRGGGGGGGGGVGGVGVGRGGVVITPHLAERVGQFFHEGDLICVVEEAADDEAELAVAEQDLGKVEPGQVVELKARAHPFATFHARVTRLAPRPALTAPAGAAAGTVAAVPASTPPSAPGQGTIIVYCRPEQEPAGGPDAWGHDGADDGPSNGAAALKPGMSGYAKVLCGRRPLRELIAERVMTLLRTEFW